MKRTARQICESKVKWLMPHVALKYAHDNHPGKTWRVYRCGVCKEWHLTSVLADFSLEALNHR